MIISMKEHQNKNKTQMIKDREFQQHIWKNTCHCH